MTPYSDKSVLGMMVSFLPFLLLYFMQDNARLADFLLFLVAHRSLDYGSNHWITDCFLIACTVWQLEHNLRGDILKLTQDSIQGFFQIRVHLKLATVFNHEVMIAKQWNINSILYVMTVQQPPCWKKLSIEFYGNLYSSIFSPNWNI